MICMKVLLLISYSWTRIYYGLTPTKHHLFKNYYIQFFFQHMEVKILLYLPGVHRKYVLSIIITQLINANRLVSGCTFIYYNFFIMLYLYQGWSMGGSFSKSDRTNPRRRGSFQAHPNSPICFENSGPRIGKEHSICYSIFCVHFYCYGYIFCW